MLLDDKITKEAYDDRYNEYSKKINQIKQELKILSANADAKKNVATRLKEIKGRITEADICDTFDRTVFECLVKKIIIGGMKDGISDPYKITFVLKGVSNYEVPDAKKRYKNLHKKVV
jgi:hypothetical protein